jgi:hypothetical protein
VLKTSALRSTVEDDAPTRTKKEKEKEKELSNLFKASTAKIGSELDLALETGRIELSLERSVREERFAHVRLVGGWNWGTVAGGVAVGGGGSGRMGFKYDPRALREAVFGGVTAGVKKRKVESVEEGGDQKDKKEKESVEAGREDVVLLAEDGTNERVVFIYRRLQPLQTPPANMDKDKNIENPTLAIGSKRPREEEQDNEYGAVYDVYRERRVGHREKPAIGSAPSTTAPATATTTTDPEVTAKGVRFAEGSKVADGGNKLQRRRRLGTTGSGSAREGDGKVVWRRTLVMRNVCESDVEFGKDGVCLWVKLTPPAAAAVLSTTPTTSITTTTTTTTTTTPATTTATAASKEKEPRLTRLEVEYDSKTRAVKTKDERRGVIFPCKVWRWRPPPRVTRTRAQKDKQKQKEEGEGEEGKMEVEV